MSEEGPAKSPLVEVVPALWEQRSVVANLLELYAYDFSDFHDVELGEDGRFGYARLFLYWCPSEGKALLIKADGRLAGLILIKQGDSFLDVAEFFVIRRWRRRGVGTLAAREVWKQFPGWWQVRVMESNVAASAFWSEAISKFAHQRLEPSVVEVDGRRWSMYRFESKPTSAISI